MTEVAGLTLADFECFFSALWSSDGTQLKPFQWQRDLMKRVLTNTNKPWPEAIALPTAAGKTACIDIAVFALAAQAEFLDKGKPVDAPRRIFFVVDRRVIVDEAYNRAMRLATKLREAKEGILKKVADNLRRVARGAAEGFEKEIPLTVHVLRGGMYRSESWARNPLQPTVVASTVDQIGSRLLFRSYGRGPSMWPVYAGLAANDSLVLLDEAHCARPFMQTLQAVRRYREWAERPLGRSFHAVVMSATPPAGLERFEDASGEGRSCEHPLGRRQLAAKWAKLEVVQRAKGRNGDMELAKAMAQTAENMVDEEHRAVVVFSNRVATARSVYAYLRSARDERVVTLLTGRMRPVDKDEVIERQLSRLASSVSHSRKLEKPHFVVATQTLEVGADLDFDALVTECASLDALRQRFGRLNRMGRPINARAAVLIRSDQAKSSEEDPVYGASLARTWAWLQHQLNDKGMVNFGISSLASRLPNDEDLLKLNAPSVDAPVMLPAHVDCWAQTGPEPMPSADVSLFLHGARAAPADVQVCWRADIALEHEQDLSEALDALTLCPPSSTECLTVPLATFKRWLAGEEDDDPSTDVQGAESLNEPDQDEQPMGKRRVLRWRGRETDPKVDIIESPTQVRPGDVLVIPAEEGSTEGLGDIPEKSAQSAGRLDAADRAHLRARAKALLRLHPKLVAAWPDCQAKDLALTLLGRLMEILEDSELLEAGVADVISSLLREEEKFSDDWRWLPVMAKFLETEGRQCGLRRLIRIIGGQRIYLAGQKLIPKYTAEAESFSDDDDNFASGMARPDGTPVRLSDHLSGVADVARRFAEGSGLPENLVRACELAGRLHDVGKADPRFQALLRGGNRWAVGELLAKSGDMPKTASAYRAACVAVGYPPGSRHELLSVRLAEGALKHLSADNELNDLVLQLIASHHGHCRPFAPVVMDNDPPRVELELDGCRLSWEGKTGLEALGSGVADRFWRLVRRYGWWGIGWLEALVRLADHRQSEHEQSLNH